MAGLTSELKLGDVPDWDKAFDWQNQFTNLADNPSGSDSLRRLFYHYPLGRPDLTTREHAVEAIDRWLAGNIEDPWLTGDA